MSLRTSPHSRIGVLTDYIADLEKSSVGITYKTNTNIGLYFEHSTSLGSTWHSVKITENNEKIGIFARGSNGPTLEQEQIWLKIKDNLDFLIIKCMEIIDPASNQWDDMTGFDMEKLKLSKIELTNPDSINFNFYSDFTDQMGTSPTVYFAEGFPASVEWEC